MKQLTPFETILTDVLQKKAKTIQPSETLVEKINNDIQRKQAVYSMDKTLKRTGIRKIAVICAICITLVSGVAYAASQASGFVSHSNRVYKTLPAIEQVQADAGFAPKYVAEFANGYQFVDGSLGNTDALDEQQNSLAAEKFVSFSYAPEGAGKEIGVSLEVSPVTTGIDAQDPNAETVSVGGIEVEYDQQHFKFVPVSYQLTKADEEAMAAGTLEVAFGSETVEEQNIQSLYWVENGLNYTLVDLQSHLTKAELLEMAKEVITVQ